MTRVGCGGFSMNFEIMVAVNFWNCEVYKVDGAVCLEIKYVSTVTVIAHCDLLKTFNSCINNYQQTFLNINNSNFIGKLVIHNMN